MKHERELELQAWLDGELPAREARRVADRVAGDREAQALLEELRTTKRFLAGNEPVAAVPESREFYWHKIQREMERADSPEAAAVHLSWWLTWRRYLAPAAGFALVALLCALAVVWSSRSSLEDPLRLLAETENLSEHTGSFAFRSHKENMFVVWVYNKDQDQAAAPESEPADDPVYQ